MLEFPITLALPPGPAKLVDGLDAWHIVFLSQVSAGLSSKAAWPEDLFHDRMSTSISPLENEWIYVWDELPVRAVGGLEIQRESVSPNVALRGWRLVSRSHAHC